MALTTGLIIGLVIAGVVIIGLSIFACKVCGSLNGAFNM